MTEQARLYVNLTVSTFVKIINPEKRSVRAIKEALRKLREYIADLILHPLEVKHLDIATLNKIEKAVEKQVAQDSEGKGG